MPDDYMQDQEFLKASPQDQHGYLMSVDQDYAKASKQDQAAYLRQLQPQNQVAKAAGIEKPGVAPISTPMPEGGEYPARPGPNGTTLRGPLTREESNRGNTGGMEIPETLVGLGVTSPIASIGAKGLGSYLGSLGRMGLRAYAGSKLGGYVGRDVGKVFKNPEAGEEVGALAGGVAGPFLGKSTLARLPFMSRAVLSNEELAAERAGMKLAQRNADAKLGLRSPVQPTFLRELPRGPIAAPDELPLRPTVGTPEEWTTYDQRMRNLKAEASDAGTYSAARGKTGKRLNYQQRIGKSFD